ncbi:MAG: hypothetical protein K2N53_03760, partial [Clostridia bacterium]|nr:hypothetical protein [Clostridia bacterium]
AFVTDKAIKALDAILSFDLDAISSAILCITDIATMGSENFGDLAAGKGKYSYRDIITHANTVGDFLVTFVDSVEDKPILRSIANIVLNKVFVNVNDPISSYSRAATGIHGYPMGILFILALTRSNLDLYKSMGMLLKDLTVADITDIYMDFNDWQVANNNDKSEDECNAKFATLATRVAKLVGKALDYAGDRESVVISASNFLYGITLQINTADILKLIDKAQDIEDPPKMTNQQALEIYRLFESGVMSREDFLSYQVPTLSVKLGTSKADFVKMFSQGEFKKVYYDEESGDYIYESLAVTQANIKDFDSSSEGYKSVTLSWGDLTAKISYFVYSSKTPKQMGIDWIQSYVSTYRRAFEKDAEVTLDEVLEYIQYDCCYTYIDPTSLFRVEVRPNDCDNLRLVGLNTSKAGEGVAYVVGEHEVMGTQVFPFNYYIIGDEKTVKSYYLVSSNSGYKVGDKFQGRFQVDYNDNTSYSLEIDEKNLSYDFTTTGCKTVTYTYEGKQYTCLVRVYSDGCAMGIDYFESWGDSYDYLKDSSQEYVFRNSTIRFNAIDSLDISDMTVSEARKALKSVSADYDITIKGFDTNQEVGEYSVTINITKSGRIVISREIYYRVIASIYIYRSITIYTSDSNTGVMDINDLQIHHIILNQKICVSDLSELSKYGEFKYDDDYGRIVFVLSNGRYIGVYIQQQT